PTGSKGPFALRRAALGIVRLVLENNLAFRLRYFFEYWLTINDIKYLDGASAIGVLGYFVIDRLKVVLREQDISFDYVEASISLNSAMDSNINRIMARVDALQKFLSTDEGGNLLAGYKRAANILKKETEIFGEPTAGTLAEEKNLFERLSKVSAAADKAIADEKFEDAMVQLATLRPAIDAFFDKVTVNSDDKAERLNRLRLLARIRDTMNRVADFSKIEG
ncbi:MAG: glycine--tRNA ligase subunit beta, partial [Alphaproteobacteria bacterium]|nr:glycine--tRNA ligase subunit beta [Alphaproteobacteria bacterium]